MDSVAMILNLKRLIFVALCISVWACGGAGSGGSGSGSGGSASNMGGTTAGQTTATTSTSTTMTNTVTTIGGTTTTPINTSTVSTSTSTASLTQSLQISKFEVAQTHVMPPEGLIWSIKNRTEDLHLSAERDTLVLIDLNKNDAASPTLQAWLGGSLLGSVSLAPPAQLPKTEDNSSAYSSSAYSAKLPAAWVKTGVQLQVTASNYLASTPQSLNVGANTQFVMRVLPFYLFGATPANSIPFASASNASSAVQVEMREKWPLSKLEMSNHGAQKIEWPSISIGPRDGQAAYVARSKNDQKDGYASMSAVLQILRALRYANGESELALQYYSPLMMANNQGVYEHPGGGLGGGSVGTGDASYTGIFIHEAGHAFGLPHQGGAFTSGEYPYAGGSLAGSAWGYDASKNQLLSPLVPPSAENYATCKTSGYQLNAQGRCIKQDPMQSGAGDQSSGYAYATFSDFSTAQMQAYLEENMYADTAFASGYKLWNKTNKTWQNASKATLDGGIYGLDNGLPQSSNVPVHAIVIAYSYAGTSGVSQIYTPLSFTGNLMRNIDPTVKADRDSIIPNTSTNYWYCLNSGCDYTLRVTYADDSTYHSVIRQGFRGWYSQSTPPASASDPTNTDSYRTWAINVPGTKAIKKIQLLDTPKVFNGMPAIDTVLLTRNF